LQVPILKRRIEHAIPPSRLALLLYLLPMAGAFSSPQADAAADRSEPSRLQSIESAIQEANFSTGSKAVVVRGIVISNHRQIVIEDRTGATEVEPLQPLQIALGDEVEVSGQMTLAPQPQIQKGAIHRLWGGSMPLPLSITPDEAPNGENELFLVQTVAELVDLAPSGLTGVRLNLRGGHQSFSAVLPSDSMAGELPSKSVQPGATLRLTGILKMNYGQNASQGDAFTIELRTPEDIELVEPPSWWIPAHVMLLGAAAMIVVLAGISGYYRAKHARYRAVAEERASIARDIHDTLAQGFAGITLQLEAAQRLIGRDPDRAETLLNEALQLIRHSRDESHLSIDILRSLSRSDRLDILIARCIQQMHAATNAAIELSVTGKPSAHSYSMESNLFRIVQEALVNAVNHADAQRIDVHVAYQRDGVLIEVRDDGKGFDHSRAPGPDKGHFGLIGMRERSAAINAKFEMESNSRGTLVRVRANA
jgi:signal transduction histidine kinase